MKKLLHWGPSFDALSIDEKDKEEEKLPYVSRYFDSYLVQLGSFGCLGLIGLARATVTSDLPRGNVCTIYNVCSHKWLCPNLPSLLSSRWFLRSCPAAKRGCGFGFFFFGFASVFTKWFYTGKIRTILVQHIQSWGGHYRTTALSEKKFSS